VIKLSNLDIHFPKHITREMRDKRDNCRSEAGA